MSLTVLPEAGALFGVPIVRFACSCGGMVTDFVLAGAGRDVQRIRREMQTHWLECHLAELAADGLGPCGVCGTITDHLQITAPAIGGGPAGGTAYLCSVHAPAQQLQTIFAGGDRD